MLPLCDELAAKRGFCVKVYSLSVEECYQVLADAGFGRLACAHENQPYVVPIYFAVGDRCLYSFALPGQKVDFMRHNPRVCVETDEVVAAADWTSVVAFGSFVELEDRPELEAERARAHGFLQTRPMWWEPGAISPEGQDAVRSHIPIFYRVAIDRITGYRARARSSDAGGGGGSLAPIRSSGA